MRMINMDRILKYGFTEDETGFITYGFLECDKCEIYEDKEHAYHFILEVEHNGKRKKYDLFWDYGDTALDYIYDKSNLLMRVAYEKGLVVHDDEVKQQERFLIYLPEREEFRIIVVVEFKDGSKNIYFAPLRFKYPKDKYLKNFDWKNCNDKINMKRPYYIAINPFTLSDLIENIMSTQDEILELHLRFMNSDMEIVLDEEDE